MNQISNKNKQQNPSREKDSEMWFCALNRVFDVPLKWYSKLVYLYLCSHCWGKKDFCFPSLITISKECGISKPTVLKAIKELEEHLFIKKQKIKDGKFTKNIFILLSTPWRASKRDLPPRSTGFTTPVSQLDPKNYKEKEYKYKEKKCVENEEYVFDSQAKDISVLVRGEVNGESPNPSREFDCDEYPVKPGRNNEILTNPTPSINKPSKRVQLTRLAIERLNRQALGEEEADLSDIYHEFEKIKTPSQ